MSLREFVASNRLTKGNLRFNGDAEGDIFQTPHPLSSASGQEANDEKLLHATKLALLLAKVFANLEQENDIVPASLRLDDFFVR